MVVTVEADSKKDAIEKALEVADCSDNDSIVELAPYRVLCEGNMLHVSDNEAYAEAEK
jgi:hypothetical protein